MTIPTGKKAGSGVRSYGFLANCPFSRYIYFMGVTQTVRILADRQLIFDVPGETPTGSVVLIFVLARAGQKVPVFACAKGQLRIVEDFGEPLERFKDYM